MSTDDPYSLADCIAKRDAAIAARAIRGAADWMSAMLSSPDRERPLKIDTETATDFANDAEWAEQILRNRADEIERAAGGGA